MNKRIFRISVLLTALFLSLASFTSCDFNADSNIERTRVVSMSELPLLIGEWESTFGEQLVITDSTVTKSSENWETKVLEQNYKGTIKNVRLLTENSGYITLLITESTESDAPYIGKYYVTHFTDLSATSVKEAAPYKDATTENNGLATQAAAEAEYTVTNGYYAMSSAYSKK